MRRVLLTAALLALTSGGFASLASAQAPAPIAVSLPAQPPKGAVVLMGDKGSKGTEVLNNNWYKRYGTDAPNWVVDKDGVVSPQKSDITSKMEFGDCYLHAEFRTPTTGHGNSGIGFQGRYEIQILGDAGAVPESHGSAALYSQKASLLNASKKSGEWQTYDIIFRAPRFDAAGQVVEKPRATVFQNGILVQNNEEFTGMTGIQYAQYKTMTPTGPIVIQGDHDVVQFRNVWVVPIAAPATPAAK
jgi:hypothetical protein